MTARMRHVHVGRTVSVGLNYRYLRCRCGARRVKALVLRFDDSSVAASWPSPLAGWQPATETPTPTQ